METSLMRLEGKENPCFCCGKLSFKTHEDVSTFV